MPWPRRPQRGRFRQFNQFGIEHIGPGAQDAFADINSIAIAHLALRKLQVDEHVKVADADALVAWPVSAAPISW